MNLLEISAVCRRLTEVEEAGELLLVDALVVGRAGDHDLEHVAVLRGSGPDLG